MLEVSVRREANRGTPKINVGQQSWRGYPACDNVLHKCGTDQDFSRCQRFY